MSVGKRAWTFGPMTHSALSSRQWNAIVHSAPDAIADFDRDNRILAADPAAEQSAGTAAPKPSGATSVRCSRRCGACTNDSTTR